MKKAKRTAVWLIAVVFFSACAIAGYFNWRPVKVIDVHAGKYSQSIIVDHLPLAARLKIAWWLKNQSALTKKYRLSTPADGNFYNISVWQFGDGYKELGKYDRFCFDDMPPPNNCIEKERLMYITLTRDGEVSYWLNDTRYVQKANGELNETGWDN